MARIPSKTRCTTLRVVAVLAGLLIASSCAGQPAARPDPGRPGAAGPCTIETSSLTNPADSRHELTVLVPSGSGSPWSGGTCDGNARPVVVVAHGFTANAVGAYQGLVNHMVSNGFVVVFPGYTNELNPAHQYGVVDAGLVAAIGHLGDRADTSRLGVVGHSLGAGMVPWLMKQSAGRGWGSSAMWAVSFAPWFSYLVGDGAIDVPAHARLTMVNYSDDRIVDARIGIEVLGSLSLPTAQRRHVMVRSDHQADPPMIADHLGPVSLEVPLGFLSTDHLDRWSAFPTVDATARCALDGTWCDADLSYLGTWPDGRAVRPAIVSTDPLDMGPLAAQECTSYLNPRPCP